MTYIEQLKKIDKRKTRVSKLLHIIDRKRSELIKKAGEELYGTPGDLIVITDSNGRQRHAKVLFVEESFFSDLPRCILEIDGQLSGTKIQIHINNPDKIIKKL
jgi:hypothetical protein